jgi:hypothetical protein
MSSGFAHIFYQFALIFVQTEQNVSRLRCSHKLAQIFMNEYIRFVLMGLGYIIREKMNCHLRDAYDPYYYFPSTT